MTTINLGGSIARRMTNPDLLEEREKRTFSREEFQKFLVEDHLIQFEDRLA
jgi:hypothetical protein